jgi:hypothetical protein
MRQMTVNQLREKFAQVCGEATNGRNKQWLIKRIAWRLQANEYGGLSEAALQRAREIANFADLRLTAPRQGTQIAEAAITPQPVVELTDKRLPAPGTIITRQYKGRLLQVEVLADGFAFEGERFKSLTAIAKRVTGTHWNGFLFFGLQKKAAS